MGEYANFIKDFPIRCREILETTVNFKEREVTLIISLASAGLVIPIERLSRQNEEITQTDGDTFIALAKDFHSLNQEDLIGHELFWHSISNSIKYKHGLKPEQLNYIADEKLPKSFKVGKFLRVIRNALAHGNVYTVGERNGHISHLTFGSSVTHGSSYYHLISLSVESFREFLLDWFHYLEKFELSHEMISSDKSTQYVGL